MYHSCSISVRLVLPLRRKVAYTQKGTLCVQACCAGLVLELWNMLFILAICPKLWFAWKLDWPWCKVHQVFSNYFGYLERKRDQKRRRRCPRLTLSQLRKRTRKRWSLSWNLQRRRKGYLSGRSRWKSADFCKRYQNFPSEVTVGFFDSDCTPCLIVCNWFSLLGTWPLLVECIHVNNCTLSSCSPTSSHWYIKVSMFGCGFTNSTRCQKLRGKIWKSRRKCNIGWRGYVKPD